MIVILIMMNRYHFLISIFVHKITVRIMIAFTLDCIHANIISSFTH